MRTGGPRGTSAAVLDFTRTPSSSVVENREYPPVVVDGDETAFGDGFVVELTRKK
jgi:hypothetical protein